MTTANDSTAYRTVGQSSEVPEGYVMPYYVDDQKARVAVTRVEGVLYAFDAARGALLWSVDTHARITTSPAVGADGNVYVGTRRGLVAVVSLYGRERVATGAAQRKPMQLRRVDFTSGHRYVAFTKRGRKFVQPPPRTTSPPPILPLVHSQTLPDMSSTPSRVAPPAN